MSSEDFKINEPDTLEQAKIVIRKLLFQIDFLESENQRLTDDTQHLRIQKALLMKYRDKLASQIDRSYTIEPAMENAWFNFGDLESFQRYISRKNDANSE